MKAAALVVVVLLLGCLTSCMPPEPYTPPYNPPYVDPYPYSFTDPSKTVYPKSLYGAQRFLEDVREPRWNYTENVGVQRPEVSYSTLSGDCDDYAVMVAAYLQWYWGFDTFILLLTVDGVGHACAFVAADSGVIDLSGCYQTPIITQASTGKVYYPVEWEVCPWWTWTNPSGPVGGSIVEWYELSGNPYKSVD